MITRLALQIIIAILGIFLAARFVPGVEFSGAIKPLLMAGLILGLANFFLKPILKAITLPLRIITLGLCTLVINLVLVWIVVDIMFPQDLEIIGLIPLLWTTAIIWVLNLFFAPYKKQ